MLQRIEPSLLYRTQALPGGIGQKRAFQSLLGVGGIGALKDDKDVVGIGGHNGFQAQVLQQGAVLVGHIDAAQVGQHLAQQKVRAALHFTAGAGGAHTENGGLRAVLTGHRLIDFLADLLAVLDIPLRASGELGADLQHAQIVGKILNVKISNRDVGLLQGILHVHIGRGVAAGQDKIGLGREKHFKVWLFDGTQV